jgi:3-oxoacyl-[acyl-carrier-protein] synthase II
MTRVVVTGIGIVSPLGIGREAFWSGLVAGRSGIGPITLFDASTFPVRFGGEVKGFDRGPVVARFPEAAGFRDRKLLLALAAADEAIADAGLSESVLHEALLCVGVGLESLCLEDLTAHAKAENLGRALARTMLARYDGPMFQTTEEGDSPHLCDDQRCASVPASGPFRQMGTVPFFLQTPLDRSAVILGNRYGFLAGRYTNCSACAAGTQVLGEAWQMLCEGQAAVALAGAADSMLNPLGLGGFSLLRILSDENHQPQRACRPFDATRQGTVLGEGAAFLVLETLDHALDRGASVYAEVLGYGSSLDAYAVSDPEPTGRGAGQSMKRAVRAAGLEPHEIDCVSAHATGTPKNDAVETFAIKEALGRRAYEIPVHAVKSMTGHMIAASGAAEAAAAVLTLARNTVPPTINLETPDPQCDLDYVSGVAREFRGDVVLSNSFGFGGQNATVIIGRFA